MSRFFGAQKHPGVLPTFVVLASRIEGGMQYEPQPKRKQPQDPEGLTLNNAGHIFNPDAHPRTLTRLRQIQHMLSPIVVITLLTQS